MTLNEQLLSEIEAFLAKHDMAPSTFGELCRNDRAFVFLLRAGKVAPRSTSIDAIRKWMADYQAPKRARPKRAAAQAAA